jgi:hypothetical protein
MSITPTTKQQYQTIKTALDKGNRVVFDRLNDKFISASKSEVSNKYQSTRYATKLRDLQDAVGKFIQNNGIETTDAEALTTAFNNRATRLRTSIWHTFGGKERDDRADELEYFETIIKARAQQHKTYNDSLLASSTGPALTSAVQNEGTSSNVTSVENSTSENQVSDDKKEVTESKSDSIPDQTVVDSSVQQKEGSSSEKKEEVKSQQEISSDNNVVNVESSDVPTAPTFDGPQAAIFGGPPPPSGFGPPSTSAKPKGPSAAHQKLTQQRALVEGEKKGPQLPAGVDAGKVAEIKKMSDKDKLELKDKIDIYLKGSKKETRTAAGKLISVTRAEDGLEKKIGMIQNRLDEHARLKASQNVPKVQLASLDNELTKMRKRLTAMEAAQKTGKSFDFSKPKIDPKTNTIVKDKSIPYYSAKEMTETRQGFTDESIDASDQRKIKERMAHEKGHNKTNEDPIANERALKSLIEAQRELISEKSDQLKTKKAEIDDLQEQIKNIESEKSGAVSFDQYADFIKDRKELIVIYKSIQVHLKSAKKEKSAKEQENERIDKLADNIPHVKREREVLANLGTQRAVAFNPKKMLTSDEFMTDEEIAELNQKNSAGRKTEND